VQHGQRAAHEYLAGRRDDADNQAAIVGGRNIGDKYFGADSRLDYNDLDVLAVGPAVREVSRAFDLYWNSASAYPAASVIGRAAFNGETRLRDGWATIRHDPETLRYVDAVRLEWIERSSEGNVVYTTEPQTGVLRRILVGFLSILPIERLL
jgi:phosphatidylserine/phosphatidylglycerophosphate/cardiolipin synthase-like enzyme